MEIQFSDSLENYILKEEYEILAKEINRLTSEEKEVLLLHSVEEFDFNEIAKVIGKTPGALRLIKYRALLKLKKRLNNG